MDGAFGKAGNDAPFAIHDAFQGGIIREHGKNHLALACIRWSIGHFCAASNQCSSFLSRPIVDRDVMPGSQEVCCHPGSHVAQPDETDLHISLLFR
jgi:hypothetical protein